MKVVVFVEGGAVHKVLADQDVELLVIDYDTEGAAEEYIQIIQGDEVCASIPNIEVDAKKVISIMAEECAMNVKPKDLCE